MSLHLIENPKRQSAPKMGACLWSGSICMGATISKDRLRVKVEVGTGFGLGFR